MAVPKATPLSASQAATAAKYGLHFNSQEQERYYRQTHPNSPYTAEVDKRFINQYNKIAVPNTKQIWNANRIFQTLSGVIGSGGGNVGQGTEVNYNPGNAQTGSGAPTNNPPLDQRGTDIINIPGNTPTTGVGTGSTNPLNKLELNSIVTAVVGFFFVRGAFKLLTKFVK